MKTKSRFAKLTSLALLVATLTIYAQARVEPSAGSQSPATAAPSEPATEFASGGISIGRGQTASIIVVCHPDPLGRDQQPVEVEFTFYDWNDNLLASETKTILPGHTSSFEMRAGTSTTLRNELTANVRVLVNPHDPRANRIVATLEVFDTETGAAQFALSCRKSGGDK